MAVRTFFPPTYVLYTYTSMINVMLVSFFYLQGLAAICLLLEMLGVPAVLIFICITSM
jgi:hypothetical protein